MDFRMHLIVILMTTAILANTSCMAGNSQSSSDRLSEFSRDHLRITAMRESKKTDKFEDLAKEIHDKWSLKDKSSYGRLMAHTLNSWASACRTSDKKIPFDRIHKYATIALSTYDPAKSDNITIEAEFALGSILHEKYFYSKGKQSDQAWEQARRKGHKRWLHAWSRMEKRFDKNWDSNDWPVTNVFPPKGVSPFGYPGMPPESIKDSALRAKYEKAIRANNEKIRIRNEQLKLRRLKKRYARIIEKYLISMYSIEPFNTGELEQYLNGYKLEKKKKARIVEKVTKNIEAQNKKSDKKLSE